MIDIGGGTTDFSLIELSTDGVLSRSVAGEHLLLGGDNVDIALAKQIEVEWNIHLQPNEWTTLCQQTRKAKEALLIDTDLKEAEVVLLTRGSSVVENMRRSHISRQKINDLFLDGFFPKTGSDSRSLVKRTGIQSMGLPYTSEPAATKHLLEFLRYAAISTGGVGIIKPDKVLFNGGTMIPHTVRSRIMSTICSWFEGAVIDELPSIDFSLAVAYGATYSGKAKRGLGVKVKSGTARSYYIEVVSDDVKKYICVMPRGIDESIVIHNKRTFNLLANHKVSFPLYSSSTRINDCAGDILSEKEELSMVAELVTIMKFGNYEKQMLKEKKLRFVFLFNSIFIHKPS